MNTKANIGHVKRFVAKHRDNGLLVRCESDFNGMTDCVEHNPAAAFRPAAPDTFKSAEHTLGVRGVWLVLRGRDSVRVFNADGLTGYHVFNSCGSFTIAVKA